MQKFKSHTPKQIGQAFLDGEDVWTLDTGNAGEDDTLIGDEDEVRADVLAHHGLETWPKDWTLERLRHSEAAERAWFDMGDPDTEERILNDIWPEDGGPGEPEFVWTDGAMMRNTRMGWVYVDDIDGWCFLSEILAKDLRKCAAPKDHACWRD